MLRTLSLSTDPYRWCLLEIEFAPDYHPCLTGQRIQTTCNRWLWPVMRSAEQIMEHYTAILPLSPRTGCCATNLEEVIILMGFPRPFTVLSL